MNNSENGCVAIAIPQLKNIRLLHLISGLDEYGEDAAGEGAVLTAITGYTEWTGNGSVTIGWDWQLHVDETMIELRRVSEPASNLVLLNASGSDIGPGGTSALLENYIDDFNWQSEAWEHIVNRYQS